MDFYFYITIIVLPQHKTEPPIYIVVSALWWTPGTIINYYSHMIIRCYQVSESRKSIHVTARSTYEDRHTRGEISVYSAVASSSSFISFDTGCSFFLPSWAELNPTVNFSIAIWIFDHGKHQGPESWEPRYCGVLASVGTPSLLCRSSDPLQSSFTWPLSNETLVHSLQCLTLLYCHI